MREMPVLYKYEAVGPKKGNKDHGHCLSISGEFQLLCSVPIAPCSCNQISQHSHKSCQKLIYRKLIVGWWAILFPR